MTHAIRFHRTGGPEVLQWEAVEPPPPGPGEVRLRHHAVGLNFIDTYHRSGLYPLALPSGLGMEGAGVVEAGDVLGRQLNTRIIIENKTADERLRLSSERFNYVLKATNEAIYDWDLKKGLYEGQTWKEQVAMIILCNRNSREQDVWLVDHIPLTGIIDG